MRSAIDHSANVFDGPMAIYYDSLKPSERGHGQTVVMLHGGAHTGACWMVTPDGRRGWAYEFADAGYHVVVPDWPGHGRSGQADPDTLSGEQVCEALAALLRHLAGPIILVLHSMGGPFGWRIAEIARDQVAAVVAIAPGPPGNIQAAPDATDEGDAWLVRLGDRAIRLTKRGLFFNIVPMVARKLVGDSTRFPVAHTAAYFASLTPTASRLILERQNIGGSQVRVEQPSRLAGLPILMLTGPCDVDHPKDFDQGIATWLSEQGANVAFEWLADRGIQGNGHMMMVEDNSSEIAAIAMSWLSSSLSAGA